MRAWSISLLILIFSSEAVAQQQAPTQVVAAIISASQISANETEIQVNAGASSGVAPGWKGQIRGISRQVVITTCSRRSCKGKIRVPINTIKQSNKRIALRP